MTRTSDLFGLDQPGSRHLARVTAPVLVMEGSKSPQWMPKSVKAVAERLPNSELRFLEEQTHIVKAQAPAPALPDFFSRD